MSLHDSPHKRKSRQRHDRLDPGDIPAGNGYSAREEKRLKRERVERLLAESRSKLPPWYFLAPWHAEAYLEGNAGLRQLDLFTEVAR